MTRRGSSGAGVAVALCLLPSGLALALLVFGIETREMTLIYASIGCGMLAVPAFVLGLVKLVSSLARPAAPE